MNRKNFAVLNFLCVLLFAGVAFAIPNPASVYCHEIGGTLEINETPLGEQGLCVISGEKFDEWKFLEGKVGQNYSWCAKNGYGIETLCGGKSSFSSCRAVCVFQNGSKRDMGYLMNLYEKIYGEEIDPDKRETIYNNPFDNLFAITPKSNGGVGKHIILQAQGSNSEDDLPDYFDWRNVNGTNFMTIVKNQVGGTCWAYSVVGTVEAKYNIEQNISNLSLHINLSERNLASNNPYCGCDYCGDYDKGGLLVSPYNFIKNVGITTEQYFPDNESPNSYPPCDKRLSNWTENLYKINDYDVFSTNNQTYIKKMLVKNGPLTVGVDHRWQSDSNGILHCTGNFQWFTHGVILVGYNDTGQYWIIKNSWGIGWGYGGYAYIKYDNCLVDSNVQKFVYAKNASLGNFSNESIYCKNFVAVCKNGTCDSETIQASMGKVCNGGEIFINYSAVFNEEIEIVKDNIILDCNNAVIDGNKTKGIGMWIIAKNTTIKNCIVKNFVYGMVLDTSSGDTLINNTLTSNTYGIYIFYSLDTNNVINNSIYSNEYGIYSNYNYIYNSNLNEILNNEILNNTVGIFSHSSKSRINSNTICGNTQLNFNSTNWQSSYGYNNTCDIHNADEWNDENKTGCSYCCGGSIPKIYFKDFDSDGYGNLTDNITACNVIPTGYVNNSWDCDDNNAGIPDTVWFADADNDTYGNATNNTKSCTKPTTGDYVLYGSGMDCDDNNASITHQCCTKFDFDDNGAIDIFDAVAALENLSYGKTIYNAELGCSDVNKDEKIDLTDIFALIEEINIGN